MNSYPANRSLNEGQQGGGRTIVSVLIVNYNGAGHLRGCLDSLVRFASSPYEIVVVDNGSTDDSLEVL